MASVRACTPSIAPMHVLITPPVKRANARAIARSLVSLPYATQSSIAPTSGMSCFLLMAIMTR